LHILVDAFLHLRREPEMADSRLLLAGWLGREHLSYAQQQFDRLDEAGLSSAYQYLGELDRQQKRNFLRQIDVLAVPTTYRDPKGLFVLEALAAGVPVIQPAHGAFPELLESTGGGRLCRPDDPHHLAAELRSLLSDRDACLALGQAGRTGVTARHTADHMARKTLEVYCHFLPEELRTAAHG
jgi:glycosyltransferase involved in cell wall biosynthesis